MRPDGFSAAAVGVEGPATWSGRGVALTEENFEHVVEVLGGVRSALAGPEPLDPFDVGDYPSAHEALSESWDRVFNALTSAVRSEETGTDADTYLDLLNEIKARRPEPARRAAAAPGRRVRPGPGRAGHAARARVDHRTGRTGHHRGVRARLRPRHRVPHRGLRVDSGEGLDRAGPEVGREILAIGQANPQLLTARWWRPR